MPHHLSSVNVRPTQFPVSGSVETVARRIAQIVEACSSEGGKPRWAGVRHYEGRKSAMDCVDPNLRAVVAKRTREELDLENLRGKFTRVTGAGRQGGAATNAGDGADGEGTFAAKGGEPGGSGAMTVSPASGERTTAGRIKSLKDACGVVLDSISPPGRTVYDTFTRQQWLAGKQA